MAYQSGVAENEIDLLDKLNLFLTTNEELVATDSNWTELYQQNINATGTTKKRKGYAWSAPGSGGDNSIYVAARTANNIADDIYNIYFAGGTYFSPQLANNANNLFSGLVNANSVVGLFADNQPLHYWFFANNRRFIIVTKMSAVYSSCYCGFMLPNSLPNEYPFPMVIAGSCDNYLRRFSIITDDSASIIDPRKNHFYLLKPDQSWQNFYGSTKSNNIIYPIGFSKYTETKMYLSSFCLSPDSYSTLYPISILDITKNATQFWGALDGVYWIPGLTRAAEDTIKTDDGREFIIFQNGFRVSNADFFAIEKI